VEALGRLSVVEYWELTLLVLTWAGIAVVWWRRRRDWAGKRFTEQVNFSLSYLETDDEGRDVLALRTLLELGARNVWLNEYGVRKVQKAAEKTTLERPFLRIRPARDMDLVRHAVLNVLSERFAQVYLARAMGAEVRTEAFLYGRTWERYGDIKTHKLRVMVVRPSDLEALFGPEGKAKNLHVTVESHRWRITTLEKMYGLVHSPEPDERAAVGEVELGVVAPPRA
jgi:hypothetical protein